jgi:ferric-dicitrate binding protein FerR (iron transport regulator)
MNPEFQDLIDRYLDGAASAEEVRRVDELIRREPSARVALLRAAAMEMQLRRLLTSAGTEQSPRPAVRPGRKPRVSWKAILAGAAAVLLAATGWIGSVYFARQYYAKCREQEAVLSRLAGQIRPVSGGRIIETRGLVLALPQGTGRAVPVSVESPIPAGRSLWTCPWGAASMRFADGASIDLDRSTEAAISETKELRKAAVKKGIVYVSNLDISHAQPVVVTTPHVSVSVLDAQAAVAVSGERTMVEVAQGQVQVVRATDGRTISVREGHYVIVDRVVEPQVEKGRLAWRLEPLRP